MPADFVTVVSGVPRTGTSLMMQMLTAGGVPPLTDGVRQPDQHNPRGYFEYEPVKRLNRDSSWVPALGKGKSLKVIYPLLRYLPATTEYRVIFMERDLREVFASQRTMLLSRGDDAASQPEAKLVAAMSTEVLTVKQWLASQPNMRILEVHYRALLNEPATWALAISNFLGGLDLHEMAAAVDPDLYRHRADYTE